MESKHVNCENSNHQQLQKSLLRDNEYSGISVIQCLQSEKPHYWPIPLYVGHQRCCTVHLLQFNIKYSDQEADTVKMRDCLILPKRSPLNGIDLLTPGELL